MNAHHQESFWTTKRLARIGMLTALSGLGALLKIPSPTGTIALDSAPGYLTAYLFGPREGALVAGLGHLLTAATAGFPLGLPLHLFVALQQSVWAVLFWLLTKRWGSLAGAAGAIVCNGIIAPACFIPVGGMAFFTSMLIPLSVGSAANIAISVMSGKLLHRKGLFPLNLLR